MGLLQGFGGRNGFFFFLFRPKPGVYPLNNGILSLGIAASSCGSAVFRRVSAVPVLLALYFWFPHIQRSRIWNRIPV